MPRAPVTAVVTTLDNATTLDACLASLAFCDELVVLDSGSRDATPAIAAARGARWFVEPFKGYGAQKQSAVDKATHDWVLLLDADEELAPGCRERIESALDAPAADGYRLARREWLFWRWPHPATRPNWHLRLFRRSCGRLNAVPVHAAPEVDGRVRDLDAEFLHHGERSLAVKVDKINQYSSGMVGHKQAAGARFLGLRLVLYPPLAFLRFYVGQRYFLNGWAGYVAARSMAFYAFLKYAKVLEAQRLARAPR
jgi:glycosyltransferase involved in cell wall biosynthesis